MAVARDTAPTEEPNAFEQLRQLDSQVLRVGFRLAVANAPFCPELYNVAGFSIHNLRQYEDQDAARNAFGFAGDYAVLALVEDGPADISGISRDDTVLSVNARDLAPDASDLAALKDQPEPYQAFLWGQMQIDEALQEGLTRISLLRDGEHVSVNISPVSACKSRFEIEPSDNFDASADGSLVKITSALADYMASDDELAAMLAHELAHNILNHRRRLNDAGISRGILQQFGRNARLTKQTEIEADRLAIWLMVNAGYDPQAAITLWTRYGKEHGHGIFSAATHYRWKKRVNLFREEITKINATRRLENGYYPPLMANAERPLEP